MRPIDGKFGAVVREARIKRRWTQRKLARRVGMHPVGITRLENGTRSTTFANWVAIIRELHLDLMDFVEILDAEDDESDKRGAA